MTVIVSAWCVNKKGKIIKIYTCIQSINLNTLYLYQKLVIFLAVYKNKKDVSAQTRSDRLHWGTTKAITFALKTHFLG